MNLETIINDELKKAVRSGDKIRLETIRSVRARIIEFSKNGLQRDIKPEDEIKILNTEAKKRREAIDMYIKGGRQELADKETAELNVIMEFLPSQLTEEDLKKMAEDIAVKVDAHGMGDLGKVMSVMMKQVAGKADGTLVQKAVRDILGSN